MLRYISKAEREELLSPAFKKKAEAAFQNASQGGFLADESMYNALNETIPPERRGTLTLTPENIAELIMNFDKDSNGKIDQEEFYQFVLWICAKRVFDYFFPNFEFLSAEAMQRERQ